VKQLPLVDAYAAMNSKFWGAYRVARAVKIAAGGSLTLVSGFPRHAPQQDLGAARRDQRGAGIAGRGLALELSPVRVNTVSPGMVATPLWSGSDEARAAKFEAVASRLPAQRIGQRKMWPMPSPIWSQRHLPPAPRCWWMAAARSPSVRY
jgi:NAD(P)-dependent dehydrogenase (short-subunit alcohol dehydrogenase family)